MRKVIRSRLARADLKEIGRYIADQSGHRNIALQFLDTIEERCQVYAGNPMLAESRPELGEDIRCFSVGKYVVFFRPHRDGIEIVRVLHASRDTGILWHAD
ncbi:MAG: type II toxin-antitoxin system RelE/ParE family toxin [Pirellulales bacterium]|nr:type II toxin-antitoxin system RelE/ParE family toxin [Pirellulales bacterium]